MQFSVFALATAPDIAAARSLYALDGLGDEAVVKVLSHHRRRQTGGREALRWDQCAIAAVSRIRHGDDGPQIDGMQRATRGESEMLDFFYRTALHGGPLVSWDGAHADRPLIRFRSLHLGVSHPAYWQQPGGPAALHLDLRDWLSSAGPDRPGLDESARRLGLPGLMDHDGEAADDAGWQAHADLVALNTYLVAVQLFLVTGQLAPSDAAQARARLRALLQAADAPWLAAFAAAWRPA